MIFWTQVQKGTDDINSVIIEAASLYGYANLKLNKARLANICFLKPLQVEVWAARTVVTIQSNIYSAALTVISQRSLVPSMLGYQATPSDELLPTVWGWCGNKQENIRSLSSNDHRRAILTNIDGLQNTMRLLGLEGVACETKYRYVKLKATCSELSFNLCVDF